MSIFEQLRGLDDDEELRSLRFASTGVPMWPFARWLTMVAAQNTALGLQPAFAAAPRRSIIELGRLAMRATLNGPLTAPPFDIVIVGSSGGITLRRDGRWFDRINDYFAMEFPDRTLMLDMAGHGSKVPRFPPNVRCFDTFHIVAGAAARLRRPAAADLGAIDRLVAFARAHLSAKLPAETLQEIRAQLVHWALRLPALRDLFARFFERVRPRVLVIEDASYGAFSHVCRWAHAAGIATAEFQHGVISRSHLAYNFGDAACRDEAFARGLPRYLLLYGEFWRGEVRTPSELVIAGYPHFSETVGSAHSVARSARSCGSVLIISQGICTDAMVRLAAAVARRFSDRRCVFRLHPGEVEFRDRYQSLTAIPNVEISDRGDLYDHLCDASVVIGHSSTALIEAAGIGLPVLLLDDEASRAIIPHDIGHWFATADELLSLVASPPASATDPGRYFAAGWKTRYRSFIERVTLAR